MLPGITRQEWERMSSVEQANWYLANVYRNEPQLTVRAILAGALLGALLGNINIYVGYKTGWTLGIGIVTAVAAFGLFQILAALKITNRLSRAESITVQSIAVMAGYTVAPLFAPLAAYTLTKGSITPLFHAIPWVGASFALGSFVAFFLKRTYVNSNPWRYPFPEGIGVGTIIREMHAHDEKKDDEHNERDQKRKIRFLIWSTVASALIMLFKSAKTLGHLSHHLVRFTIPEFIDRAAFKLLSLNPTINGFTLKQLAIGFETDIVLGASGVLISLRSGASMALGAIINYGIIAPILMHHGIIDKNGGFRAIVGWSVWFGGSIMFGAAVISFFSTVLTRKNIRSIVENLKRSGDKALDPLARIEVPAWVSVPGILVSGTVVSVLTWKFFGTPLWINFLTIVLLLPLSILAVHATAETGTTPGSTTSKITQLSLSLVQPGQAVQNLMAAGIVTEASLGAAQLCVDLRPGHMLGANARSQIVAHFIGIVVGIFTLIPIWYYLVGGHVELIGSDTFPVPAAKTWKAVSEALAGGFGTLHYTSRTALLIGLMLGVGLELLYLSRQRLQEAWDAKKLQSLDGKPDLNYEPLGRRPWGLPLSTVGFGFGFVLQFTNSFVIFLGSLTGALLRRRFERQYTKEVAASKDREVQIVAGGVMAGGSIMGIVTALVE